MAKNDSKSENKHFYKDFKAEIKKIIWPTPKQLVNNTVAIVTMVIVVCVIVLIFDFAFKSLNNYGLLSVYKAVQNTASTSESNDSTNTTVDTEATNVDNEVDTDTDSED